MKTARLLPLALVALFLPLFAHAATATINWIAPTTAYDNATPLTGAAALTSYQVWIATSSISSTTTSAPTATVTTGTTTTQPVTAQPGDKIYARVKACNAGGCSNFSAEASSTVPIPVPGVPTTVTITISP